MSNAKILVKTRVLREELGVGATYMSELLKACNLKGHRIVHRDTVLKFLKENPGWKMSRHPAKPQ